MKVTGTIREIEQRLKNEEVDSRWVEDCLLDTRTGVQNRAKAYLKKQDRIRKEKERMEKLWNFERTYWQMGYRMIAGLDEAGRGPLAGPVTAAAVILPENFDVSGLDDSKKLSPESRQTLRTRIEQEAIAVGVSIVDHQRIDEINILQATYLAMRQALQSLEMKPDFLLLDAVEIPEPPCPQRGIIKGDGMSHSIAAASIIAKTVRDEWMMKAAEEFPEYGFDRHMGYCTAEHLVALDKWGPCAIHRRSFAPVGDRV
ncbi:RNase HII [Marininema mesophilum]|uniref:Ribonuclease HII n=1 Tax=Marininema mesophilum TaxID=1048340 RepID=A0A1H2Q068_9BACL|nr:ribonuclease HII [Marininema mesophilum]SDW00503.1 RNase HII [Marininema mesophilum]